MRNQTKPTDIDSILLDFYMPDIIKDLKGESKSIAIEAILGSDEMSTVKQALHKFISEEIIGEERTYDRYGPCPTCGSQYQYRCGCDEVESALLEQQRQRLNKSFGVDSNDNPL